MTASWRGGPDGLTDPGICTGAAVRVASVDAARQGPAWKPAARFPQLWVMEQKRTHVSLPSVGR